MRIDEIFPSLKLYAATIGFHVGSKTTTVTTAIYAASATEAKAMLTALYEVGSVLSFEISESALPRMSSLPLNAEQLGKKSVKDAKARDAATDEANRLSKKIVTAQHKAVKDAAARFRACQ